MAAIAVVVWTGAAFRVRFMASLPWLGPYAAAVSASNASAAPVAAPRRVGFFAVREVELLPQGVVRLITTDCMFDHCGLVFSPNGRPPVVGEDNYVRLPSGWWQWLRSW